MTTHQGQPVDVTDNIPKNGAPAYDPIPHLARLVAVAQRQGYQLPGLSFVLASLQENLGLPNLAYTDEVEAALRKALGALRDITEGEKPDA